MGAWHDRSSDALPEYYDFNVVRVEDDPAMGVEALVAFADEALAGLAHRRVDFDLIDAAEPLQAGFEAKGWKSLRLLWMRHEGQPPPGSDVAVEEVPYDAVHDLRVAWHREDFPDQDPAEYHAQAREVALRRDVQVLAVCEGGAPVAFAQLERDGAAAEMTQVYVHPEHRGGGRGTAMTRAAIRRRATSGTSGSPQTTTTGRRSSTPGSAFARHGRRWSSYCCLELRALDQLDPVPVGIAHEAQPRSALAHGVRRLLGLDALAGKLLESPVEVGNRHGDVAVAGPDVV